MASRITGGNTAYKRNGSDFYPTPCEVTLSLLNFLMIPKNKIIWEPACGDGDMSRVMQEIGYTVKESDIQKGEDFLEIPIKECDWIITNPPFSKAEQFIRRCNQHNKPFALLLKSQYWHAKKRYNLFDEITPSIILPLTWRPDFCFRQRGRGSPLMDVMWVVWDLERKNHLNYPLYIPLLKQKN